MLKLLLYFSGGQTSGVSASRKMDLVAYFCNVFAVILLQAKCLQSYIDIDVHRLPKDSIAYSWKTGTARNTPD